MILIERTAAKQSLFHVFRLPRGCGPNDAGEANKTHSRIAYKRSFRPKWYRSTPLIWPTCRYFLILSDIYLTGYIATGILFPLLISLWVAFYMRHLNPLGRFLREATGVVQREGIIWI